MITQYSDLLAQEELNLIDVIEEDIWIQSPHYFKLNSNIINAKLEFIVTPECNQSCDYCYIYQHGKELYPIESRANKGTTLNNLRMILDYYIYEKKYFYPELDLFAGDLFTTNYFFDIMDILYPYYNFMYEKAPELFVSFKPSIIIPSNLRFVEDQNIVNKIYETIEKFKKIKTKIHFSWSSDGKYGIKNREKKEMSDDYWEKCFIFIKNTGGGIHSILAPENIEYAIENYKWWINNLNKYLPERIENNYTPYFLEARNANWTDEKIHEYLKFIQYIFYDFYEKNDCNTAKLIYSIFVGDGKENTQKRTYQNIIDSIFNCIYMIDNTDEMTCSLQKMRTIRLSDLAIVPCHRTSYDLFIAGKYISKDNHIIGFEPHNIEQYINLKFFKANFAPKCCTCWNQKNCLKGCIGSQFETFGELYIPILKVCDLLQAKTSYCLMLLNEVNGFDIINSADYIDEDIKKHLYNLRKKLGQVE